MENEFLKYLIQLGVGGTIAGLIFIAYRKDIRQYTELWKSTSDSLILVVKENTASNVKLIALIENMERNVMRKADIEALVERKMKG